MLCRFFHMLRLLAVAGAVVTLILIFSCGVSDPDPQPGSGNGKVVLFITDNISYFKQVVSTITGVRMINSGTGEVCEVMVTPVTYDIANLTNMAQYAALAECPAGRYNRVDIDVKRGVQVMDELGAASPCAFTSYLDGNGAQLPLVCDPSDICTLSVRGGQRDVSAQVQEDRYNDLGIDFNLKQFTITGFGNPSECSVVMAVSLKSAVEMNDSGRAHGVTGVMTGLDTAGETFTLLSSGVSLTVDYSGILPSLQPNIDDLLLFARTEGLPVNVLTGGIEIETGSIVANRIFVKAAGTASKVKGAPEWTFDLEYKTAGVLHGSFKPPAAVQGDFIDGVWVNVKFDGYHAGKDTYSAASVEVLPSGTVLGD